MFFLDVWMFLKMYLYVISPSPPPTCLYMIIVNFTFVHICDEYFLFICHINRLYKINICFVILNVCIRSLFVYLPREIFLNDHYLFTRYVNSLYKIIVLFVVQTVCIGSLFVYLSCKLIRSLFVHLLREL